MTLRSRTRDFSLSGTLGSLATCVRHSNVCGSFDGYSDDPYYTFHRSDQNLRYVRFGQPYENETSLWTGRIHDAEKSWEMRTRVNIYV